MFEFTICESAEQGRCPTKTFTRQPDGSLSKQNYSYITWWRFRPLRAPSIDVLAVRLRFLADDPTAMLIHGEPLDWDGKYQARLWADPAVATLRAVLRKSIAIDIDKKPLPPEMAALPFGEQAKWLRDNRLPLEFHGVKMITMPSASTSLGAPGIFNGRLFVAFEEAADLKAIKAWAKGLKLETGLKIDSSIYQAGQPIFVARPLFLGMNDPIAIWERAVVIPGDRDRAALQIGRYEKPLRAAERKAEAVAVACGGNWLQRIEMTVGLAPLCEFYKPLSSAIGLAARSGAPLEDVQAAVAAILANPARNAGADRQASYGPGWVKRTYDRFLGRDARAGVEINELKTKLFG